MDTKVGLRYTFALMIVAVATPAYAALDFLDMGSVFDKALAAGLSFLAAGMVVLMAICFIFTATLADMLIYIGLALGPFLLALSPLRVFSRFGQGWLSFMMTALVYKATAAVMLKMMEGIFDQTGVMLSQAIGSAPAGGVSFPRVGALLALLGITIIGIMAALRITSIADQIMSGGGGGGFGAPSMPRLKHPGKGKGGGEGSGKGGDGKSKLAKASEGAGRAAGRVLARFTSKRG